MPCKISYTSIIRPSRPPSYLLDDTLSFHRWYLFLSHYSAVTASVFIKYKGETYYKIRIRNFSFLFSFFLGNSSHSSWGRGHYSLFIPLPLLCHACFKLSYYISSQLPGQGFTNRESPSMEASGKPKACPMFPQGRENGLTQSERVP